MATEILELQLRVTGGDTGASQFGTLEKAATGATKALSLLRNALVLASSVRLASGIFEIVDSFQRMQNQLLAVLNTQALVNTGFNDLFNIAQKTRTPLDATVTLFSRMARAGAALGINLGDIETAVTAVNESFIINASTANESRGAVLQLSHELASGQVRGRSLLSVIQAGPAIAQAFADEMFKLGLTVDQYGNKIQLAGPALYNFVKAHQGLLTGKIAFQALVDGAQKIQEQFDKTNPTIGTLGTQIKNSFEYISGTLLNASGLLGKFNSGLAFIRDNMGVILAGVGAVGLAFAGWLVLDVITAQFAKLFELKGIFGFILSPITNIAAALKNLAVSAINAVTILYNVGAALVSTFATLATFIGETAVALGGIFLTAVEAVGSAFAVMAVSIGPALISAFTAVTSTLFAFSGGIQVAFAGMGIGVNIALAAAVALRTLSEAFEVTTLTAGLSATAVQFLEYTLVGFTALGAEAIGTVTTISTGFRQLVTVTGGVAEAFVSMGEAALAAIGPALLSVFASMLILLPTLILAAEGLTLAFSGLVALGSGILSLGGIFDGLASSTISWKDIFNSFFKVVIAGFDIIANHLPLVFQAISEQWHNLIADLISVLPTLYQGIRGYLLEPILKIVDVIAKLAPIVGALAGAALGGLPGAVIGTVVGGAAGITAEHFKDAVESQFDDLGVKAGALAAEAGQHTGTVYTDQLVAAFKSSMAGHQGDFYEAFKELGQGKDLATIARNTGVAIGDLQTAQKFKSTFLPSPGVVPTEKDKPKRDPLANTYDQDRQALDNLAQGVDPYAKFVADSDKTDKVFDKIRADNLLLAAAGKQVLDVDEQLNKLGLTKQDILDREARALSGVGNASTDLAGKTRILNDLVDKGKISYDEYYDALVRAQSAYDDTVKGHGSTALNAGIDSALNANALANANAEPIAKAVITSATSSQQAIEKYKIEVQALNLALAQRNITEQQYADQLRDSAITALNAQTDATSGYERAVLKLQKTWGDAAANMEEVFTTVFNDIDTQFQSFLKGGKFDFSKIGQDLADNAAKQTSHAILSPILNSLVDAGGVFGALGGALGDSLNKPDGSSAAPFWVRLYQDPLAAGLGALGGGSSSGGNFLSQLLGGGGGSSGGGIFGNLFQSIFGGGGETVQAADIASSVNIGDISADLPSLLGFKTGGEFDVGGSGGSDSQLVAFKATPGEHVSVGQPSGGDVNVVINDMRTSSSAAPVEQQSSTGPNGQKQLEVFIRDVTNRNISQGAHDTAFTSNFGIQRAAAPT